MKSAYQCESLVEVKYLISHLKANWPPLECNDFDENEWFYQQMRYAIDRFEQLLSKGM